jgi:YbbR domain-containing protein
MQEVMEKKRFPIIIATTLFAVLLWLSVNMSYDYQVVVSVPLIIENLPRDKAIATPFPKSVQLKLRGNGWRSAALMLGADPRCIIDASSLGAQKHPLVLNDVIDRVTIPIGIQPVDMKPESLYLGFDRYTQKRVPVLFNAEAEFRPGYGQVGETIVTPESVTLGGAASLLATIAGWPTTHTMFTDLKSPLDAELPLADSASHYLSLSPQAVHVKIDVQQFAEKTITGLPVETHAVPQNKEVILIPPRIDLVVRGGVEQLGTLGNDSFNATVDYGVIVADSTGYTDPVVVSPKGVQLVTKKPERMQFIIRTKL